MLNKKSSLFIIVTILFFWSLIFFIIPSEKGKKPIEVIFSGSTMGTTYEVKISKNISSPQFVLIQAGIDSLLKSINQSMSTYISDSEISKINNFNDSIPIDLSYDFSYVLAKSLYYHKITNGGFDVTVKPLLELWGFRGKEIKREPYSVDVENIRKYVGSDKFIYDKNKNSLIKKHPKVQFDFGAIAKGYAVDLISLYLEKLGYSIHYVEIGGEIICKGKDWHISIAYPQFNSNKFYETIVLSNHAIATSGTYNNSFKIDEFEYSHIFNPRLGYPSKNNVISVTVISNKCIDSDALATSLKVLDYKKGIELINGIEDTECMFIIKEDEVLKNYCSNNFLSFLVK